MAETNQDLCAVEEDSPKVQEAIENLRTLILEEKNLHIRMDDRYMLRHLYGAEFDVQLAFNKLQTYYTLKYEIPDIYCQKPVREYKPLLDLHTHVILPGRDNRGRRVLLVRMGNIDTSKMAAKHMTILDELWLEAVQDEPETQRSGTVTLTDMAGYSLTNLSWLTPTNVQIGARKAESLPYQKHEHHIVNTSMVLNAVVSLMFPFLSANTKKNVFFHYHDFESLHKHINPEVLPKEYGGILPAVDYEAQCKTLLYDQEDKLFEVFQQGYVTKK